jgi:hypothetical protein
MFYFMPINKMLYRVFLQDEKDAPSPMKNPENHFRIRSGEILARTYTNPDWMPNLQEQLRRMDWGSYVGPDEQQLDEHWLIRHDCAPIGIVHFQDEISEKAYKLALREALEFKEELSRRKGKPYIFIDATSREARIEAERLSRIVKNELV